MRSNTFRNIGLMLLVNLLIKPLWILGVDRSVQLAVGPESYGLYYVLFNFSFWFQIILDPGLHTFANRSVSRNQVLFAKYFEGFLPLKLLLSAGYIVLTLASALIFNFRGEALHMLLFLCFNQALASLTLWLRSYLAALQRFGYDSIVSVMDRVLLIVLCGGALIFFPKQFSISSFVYAQTFSYGLTLILCFFIVLRLKVKLHSQRAFFKWKPAFLGVVLRQSYPFALLAILMTLYTRIDSFMIEQLLPKDLGLREAGLYASAYRLLEAANNFALLFATVLLPTFSLMLAKGENAGPLSSLSFRALIIPAFLLSAASWFYREPIMGFLYKGTEGSYGAELFGTLMLTFLCTCTVYIYGTLLTAEGALRFLNIVSAAGVIGNVLLNYILIPWYGAFGAALATLATQGTVSLIQMLYALRRHKVALSPGMLGRGAAFIGLSLLCYRLAVNLPLPWAWTLLIATLVNCIFALGLKLLRPMEFKRLLIQ